MGFGETEFPPHGGIGEQMENQHQHIRGYRDLSQEEISSMNTIKDMAENIRVELEALESLPDVDKRWLAIGKTNLQQGFMAVIRSIAKPTTF